MELALSAVFALLSATPLTSERARNEQVMQDIEKQVQLPDAAKPMHRYVRYYANSEASDVIAIYMLPGLDDLPDGEDCEVYVPEGEGEGPPCSFEWPKSIALGAGNRVWLPEKSSLPFPMQDAGACDVVTLVYRTSTRRFLEVVCYGQSSNH